MVRRRRAVEESRTYLDDVAKARKEDEFYLRFVTEAVPLATEAVSRLNAFRRQLADFSVHVKADWKRFAELAETDEMTGRTTAEHWTNRQSASFIAADSEMAATASLMVRLRSDMGEIEDRIWGFIYNVLPPLDIVAVKLYDAGFTARETVDLLDERTREDEANRLSRMEKRITHALKKMDRQRRKHTAGTFVSPPRREMDDPANERRAPVPSNSPPSCDPR